MNLYSTPRFQTQLHNLIVIQTDLVEAEGLIRQIAADETRKNPQNFAGKTPCVFFKMPYIPPYEPFKELRHLILRVHENTGLRACYKGIVAIDTTDWVGHESEEYFSILLKYLYDHRDVWIAAMIVNNPSPAQLQRFLSVCVKYITPRAVDARLFSDRSILSRALRKTFREQGAVLCQEAEEHLVSALQRDELKDVRSLTLLERTAEEIIQHSGGATTISAETVYDYLSDPYAALTMMAGKTLTEQRRLTDEDENLHL